MNEALLKWIEEKEASLAKDKRQVYANLNAIEGAEQMLAKMRADLLCAAPHDDMDNGQRLETT